MRSVIIGTGGIAASHVSAFRENADRAELVAAFDLDPGRGAAFCQKHRIPRCHHDLDGLLAREKPDLVSICTPPAFHAALSIRCMEAGAWVLCEKPLCGGLSELDDIEAAEERTGKYTSSVFQWRFGSGAGHLRRLIESRTAGSLLTGICHTLWYRPAAYYEVPWRGKWNTELGGPTMGHGIHAMDLFLWLMGDWKEILAMAGTLDRPIEVEDVSTALVRFENGALGTVVNSVLGAREESYLRFDLQRATAELRHLYVYADKDWSFTPAADAAAELAASLRAMPPETPVSHASQLAALLDSMERGERPLVSGDEARRTLEFISCLYKSAATNSLIRRGSLTRDDPFYRRVSGHGAQERPL